MTNLIGAWGIDDADDAQTSTTDLIREWSMDGAVENLDGGFGSPVNALAVATAERARLCGTAYDVPILVKRPEDDNWLPLHGSAGDATGASDLAKRLNGY